MSNFNTKQIALPQSRIPFGDTTGKMVHNSGLTFDSSTGVLNVNYLKLALSLLGVIQNGVIESNGSRLSYATSSVRKQLAYTDDPNTLPEILTSNGQKYLSTTFSFTNQYGRIHNYGVGNTALEASTISGSSSDNVFTRTSGTWTAGSLVGLHARLIGAGFNAYREVVANTTTELIFKKSIVDDFSPTSIQLHSDTIYINHRNISWTNIRSIHADSNYIYVFNDNNIFKVNSDTLEHTTFNHGLNCNDVGWTGNYFLINSSSSGTDNKIYIPESDSIRTLTGITGVDASSNAYKVCSNGKFIYTIYSGQYTKYDLSTNAKTNVSASSLPVNIQQVSTIPNGRYIYVFGTNAGGTAYSIYRIDTTNDTTSLVSTGVGNRTHMPVSAYDGYNSYYFRFESSELVRVNDLDGLNVVSTVAINSALSNPIFDGKHLIYYSTNGSDYGFTLLNLSNPTVDKVFIKCQDTFFSGNQLRLLYLNGFLYLFGSSTVFKFKLPNSSTKELKLKTVAQDVYQTEYILSTEDYIPVNTSSISKTRILPDATKCKGHEFEIKDTGNALVNNITINTVLSQTIDGSASFTINVSKACLKVVSNGTNYDILNLYIP